MSVGGEASRRPGRPRDQMLAERRREEILRHAIRLFATRGYAGTDLDTLAADTGCAKGTLYNYFKDKCELFGESVDLVMRELLEATYDTPSDDPFEQLEHAVRCFLAYFDANPHYIELLIQERAEFRDRQEPTYFKYRETHRERWRQRFRKLMAAGRMRQMPMDRALDVVGDLLYGTIFINYFAHRRKNLEQQAADILDVLFFGFLTPVEACQRQKRLRDGGKAAGES